MRSVITRAAGHQRLTKALEFYRCTFFKYIFNFDKSSLQYSLPKNWKSIDVLFEQIHFPLCQIHPNKIQYFELTVSAVKEDRKSTNTTDDRTWYCAPGQEENCASHSTVRGPLMMDAGPQAVEGPSAVLTDGN